MDTTAKDEHAADAPSMEDVDIAIEIPDQEWAKIHNVWAGVKRATLHWRRGRKRFSAACSTWEQPGDATPLDMMRDFYEGRVSAQERAMGEDLEWMVVLFDGEGNELERVKWAYLMNPVDESNLELLGVVKGLVGVMRVQQSILNEANRGRAADQAKQAEMFDLVLTGFVKGLEMQATVVDSFAETELETMRMNFRQEALRELVNFAGEHTDVLRDIFGARKTADPQTLDQVPPDLAPFAAAVLSDDRTTVERYLATLSEDDARLMRARLRETEAGREVLRALSELMGGA
jgi:hypothetical protein